MAYKRFFHRNGKTFGPYYYESYRDKTGKIKKKYVGREDPDKNKNETRISRELGENTYFDNKTQENDVKKPSNNYIVSPTNFNLRTLIILLTILILTDISFIIFYLR